MPTRRSGRNGRFFAAPRCPSGLGEMDAVLPCVIGHCKNDRKVGARNWLEGRVKDKINAISVAIGFNLRKILRKIFFAVA